MSRSYKKEEIEFRYNFKIYLSFLKRYKLAFLFLLVATLFLEGLLIADKYLFKIIVDQGTLFAGGELAKSAFISILLLVAGAYAIFKLLNVVASWFRESFLIKLDSNMVFDLKKRFFNHIIGLDHNFHTTHKTGSLISRLNRGANAAENMNDILAFNFAPLILQIIIVSISLAYFSLIPGIILAVISIAFISFGLFMERLREDPKLKYNNAQDKEKASIGDVFTNIDSIKYFGKDAYIKNRFAKTIDKTRWAAIRYMNLYKWASIGYTIILGLGTLAMLYFPIVSFLAGEITIGTVVFIYTIYGGVVMHMFGFTHGLRSFYRSMADFQDLFEYGKRENEIKDFAGAKILNLKQGTIEFKNVDFAYGKRKLLKNFNLKIKKNEKVALVGHSGCGKTTLIKLLNRLYDVDKGHILMDGKDIRKFKQESLRGATGIVPQECILFDDTIYNNIKFANSKATKKEVMAAIKFAQLDTIIDNFPEREKTIVGERGVKLSGGEKQRVSIARAILANKKVLVLDEATSSLDSETEYEIQKDLQRLLEGRTSIIIAHRLSTIMNADRIIVLEKGKIIQQGKHRDLISKPGAYRKLWNLQKGGYIK